MFLKSRLTVIIYISLFYCVVVSEGTLKKNSSELPETVTIGLWPNWHPCRNQSTFRFCVGVKDLGKKTTVNDIKFNCEATSSFNSESYSNKNISYNVNDTDIIGGYNVYNTTIGITNLVAVHIDTHYIEIGWTMFNGHIYRTINNLIPCTTYEISVDICFTDIHFTRAIHVTTAIQKPSIVRKLNITEIPTSSTTSLNISWGTPVLGAKCISSYVISLEMYNRIIHSETIHPTLNSAIVTDLSACTVYTVTVDVYDTNYEKGNSVVQQSPPTSYRVLREPRIINTYPSKVTNSSVTLLWNVTDEKNDCPDLNRYLLCECYAIGTQGYGYHPLKNSSQTFKMKFYSGTLETTNTDLSPFTNYKCRALIYSKFGFGPWSLYVSVKTLTVKPSPPADLNLEMLNTTAVRLTWKKSKYMPTVLRDYSLEIIGYVTYHRPSTCSNTGVVNFLTMLDKNLTSYDYIYPLNYARYLVTLYQEVLGKHVSFAKTTFENTVPKAPGKVKHFNCVIQPKANDSNALEIVLSWEVPCIHNGILDSFYIQIYGSRNNSIHNIEKKIKIYQHYHFDKYIYRTDQLKPQYQYLIKVHATTKGVSEPGDAVNHIITYPSGIPPQPDDVYMKMISFDPYKTKRSTTSAVVLLPLFPNTNGDILYYAVLVTEQGFGMSESRRYNLSADKWPDVPCWKEAHSNNFKVMYQPTKEYWDPFANKNKYISIYGNLTAVRYMIGDDSECESVSDQNPSKTVYCNGPLKSDTWYEVRLRGFTNGGYTDSTPVLVKTRAYVQVFTVVEIITAILTVGLGLTILVIFLKSRKSWKIFAGNIYDKEYFTEKHMDNIISSSSSADKY